MKRVCSSMPIFLYIVILGVMAFVLVSCNTFTNQPLGKTPLIENKRSFHLAILDPDDVFKLGSGSTYYETLWPRLEQTYTSSQVHTITENDIEIYNWKIQELTLTPEASEILLKIFDCSSDQEKFPYPLCLVLPDYLFVVAPNDIPLYGGVFTESGSTLSRTYPVIYPTFVIDDNQKMKVVFTILSGHPARKSSKSAWATPGWDLMKDERIKTIFSDLGKLIE